VFLFVSEDGTISGWRMALGTNAEVLQTADPLNVYKGALGVPGEELSAPGAVTSSRAP
jgi:hypothetical protein